jgi:hypothetical protein
LVALIRAAQQLPGELDLAVGVMMAFMPLASD